MPRLLFIALLSLAAFAQEPPQHRYLISIGDGSSTVSSGKLWLYSYSWYGLQSLKLADIENGLAVVSLDVERLKRELNPHPNTDGYVVVVQVGEHSWYRTQNFAPALFWSDLRLALDSLGRATDLPSGETRMILSPPARRRITLLYPDGQPARDAELHPYVYLAGPSGHCGGYAGLPLGTFRTDEKGTVVVEAPLIPLYLEGIEYYEDAGSGPTGPAYTYSFDLKLGSEETLVLRKQWRLTDDDYLDQDLELRVLSASGAPPGGRGGPC